MDSFFLVKNMLLKRLKIKLVERVRRNDILFKLAVRVVSHGREVQEKKKLIKKNETKSNSDHVSLLTYALASATDPLAALNHYSSFFGYSPKMLWQAVSALQQDRAPAFNQIMAAVSEVTAAELRIQILIKRTALQQSAVGDYLLNSLMQDYIRNYGEFENPASVKAALGSVLIEKSHYSDIEARLRVLGIGIVDLTETQKLKFLSRMARARDKTAFLKGESLLLPLLSEPARLKVSLMRFSLFGEDNAFAKLEAEFCHMQFDIAKTYMGQLKTSFDSIPEHRNFLNARFDKKILSNLQNLILHKLVRCEPFSYMRMGDGESYGFVDGHYVDDKGPAWQELHWWGEQLSEPLRIKLQSQFKAALAQASLLGVPSVIRLIRDFNLSKRGAYPRNSLIPKLLCVMNGVSPFLSTKLIVEDQSNIFLFDETFIQQLFGAAKKVYVVSGLQSAKVMGWAPDVSRLEHVELPTHRLLRNSEIGASTAGLFPYVYQEYIDYLSDRAGPGVLFLVSAGFIGKIVIAEVASKGAVALDIGQALVMHVTEAQRGM